MDAARTRQFSIPIAVCAAIMAISSLAVADRDSLVVVSIVGWVTVIVEATVIRAQARELEWRGK